MLQNKSVVCSSSQVTNSTVMKLDGSDNKYVLNNTNRGLYFFVVVLFWQYQPQNWPSSLLELELLRELPCATSKKYTDPIALCPWPKDHKYTDLTCSLSLAKGPQVHRSDLLFVLGQRTTSTQI